MPARPGPANVTQGRAAAFRWRIAVLLLGAGAAALASMLASAQTQGEQAAPEAQLATINSSISRIETWLSEARQQRSQEEAALDELNTRIDSLNDNIADNQREIDSLNSELSALDAREQSLLADSEAQRVIVARALRASYTSGQDSQLQLLLTQQDPATAQRMLVYFNAFNEERLQQIKRFQATLAQLGATRDDIAAARQTLELRNRDLSRQRQQLESGLEERRQLIASLNADMARRGTELEQLLEDRALLQELIEEINRIIVDIPSPEEAQPFANARGQLPWPLSGTLLASYGERYGGGNLQRQGIIIAAQPGSPVRAAHNGRVVFADWLRGSGNLVVVDHGNGYITLYAHLQDFNKNTGDWVNRGEALALSGADAGTGAPGLYFEIRQNSRTLNPAEWLEQ